MFIRGPHRLKYSAARADAALDAVWQAHPGKARIWVCINMYIDR